MEEGEIFRTLIEVDNVLAHLGRAVGVALFAQLVDDKSLHWLTESIAYGVVVEKCLHHKEGFPCAVLAKGIYEFVVDHIHRPFNGARFHHQVRDCFQRERESCDLCSPPHLDAEHFVFRRLCEIEADGLQIFRLHLLPLLFPSSFRAPRFAKVDFEINFGKSGRSKRARKEKRQKMEAEYLQAIGFYLAKPPKYKVLGVEVRGTAKVAGLPLPLKAVSDLVVESRTVKGAVDVVDHKFVDTFSKDGARKTLFMMQALFNYYTVSDAFGKPVKRFIVNELRKKRNADGTPQMRKYIINFDERAEDFALFHRLIKDATEELRNRKVFLPNPSDMFEGENSFDIYRLGL